jgi:hypothetical protein
MHIDGRCHCGALSFAAEVDPKHVLACHCTECRTLSGGPLRAAVTVPVDAFSVRGALKGCVKIADSDNRRAQYFCPECGTNFYAAEPDRPTWVSIRRGCVEPRAQLAPVAQIWLRSATAARPRRSARCSRTSSSVSPTSTARSRSTSR